MYYFFFFGFFFFTAAAAADVPGVGTIVLEGPGCGVDARAGSGEGSFGRRFCIFSIRERLSASNRLRKIDEWVLNLRH
jgi:hypothetical protein